MQTISSQPSILHNWPIIIGLITSFLLSACIIKPEGIGKAISWDKLPGWEQDNHAQAWPALKQTCTKLRGRNSRWSSICNDADGVESPDDKTARKFFETWFVPHQVNSAKGKDGLVTGYYEPLLYGSLRKTPRYRYPIYAPPENLLTIDLGGLYPTLKGKTIRGRLDGKRVIPYFSRAEINRNRRLLAGKELLWVDDPVALFFLHIQGSGRVLLTNGDMVAVGYANQNGHPYVAIGRVLVDNGYMTYDQVSLQSIREWLGNNPDKAGLLLQTNPSYIFFILRKSSDEGPVGTLNVPLTSARSIAVDRKYIPLGNPVWLVTTLPDDNPDKKSGTPLQRLVFAQDTGGAISGATRVDLFWGQGARAENLAGKMKQEGRIYVLIPAAEVTK